MMNGQNQAKRGGIVGLDNVNNAVRRAEPPIDSQVMALYYPRPRGASLQSIKCSHCNSAVVAASNDAALVRKVAKVLLIKCKNFKNGCKWTGTLREWHSLHSAECPYPSETCPHCRAHILKRSIKTHLDTCGSVSVNCPYGGRNCAVNLLRKDVPAHEWACEHQPCLYRDTKGCKERGTKAEMEMHALRHRFGVLRKEPPPDRRNYKEMVEKQHSMALKRGRSSRSVNPAKLIRKQSVARY